MKCKRIISSTNLKREMTRNTNTRISVHRSEIGPLKRISRDGDMLRIGGNST